MKLNSNELYKNNQKYADYIEQVNYLWRIPLTFRAILNYLNPQPSEKILEIGCNKGEMVEKIKQYSKNTVGIDINEEAAKQAVTSGIVNMDACSMSFPRESFDKIYSNHTIEHIPDLNKFIKEIDRVLKPGGIVVLSYPFEILRGDSTLIYLVLFHKNLSSARQFHLHKLTPNRIKKIITDTNLYHLKSKIHFVPNPSYFTVLKKSMGV